MAKRIEEEEDIDEEDESFNDRYDVIKHISDVHSRISKPKIDEDVGTDFVLAKLNDKDKEFITESTQTAYYIKGLLRSLANRASSREERKKILRISNLIFDMYMNHNYMIAVLSRNVPNNYILRLMLNHPETEKVEEIKEESRGLGKLVQALKGKVEPENNG